MQSKYTWTLVCFSLAALVLPIPSRAQTKPWVKAGFSDMGCFGASIDGKTVYCVQMDQPGAASMFHAQLITLTPDASESGVTMTSQELGELSLDMIETPQDPDTKAEISKVEAALKGAKVFSDAIVELAGKDKFTAPDKSSTLLVKPLKSGIELRAERVGSAKASVVREGMDGGTRPDVESVYWIAASRTFLVLTAVEEEEGECEDCNGSRMVETHALRAPDAPPAGSGAKP